MTSLLNPSLPCWARRDSEWSSVERAGVSGAVTCQTTSPWQLLGSPMPPWPAVTASVQDLPPLWEWQHCYLCPSDLLRNCLHQFTLLLKNSYLLMRNYKILVQFLSVATFACHFCSLPGPTCYCIQSCLCVCSALPRKTPPTARSCPVLETKSVSWRDLCA